ncbi:hypothetical protein ElyMa_001915600 [Elysia marginata]|uniref:Uncharacterized protein n=1 Tax=Elysia marginata TaxID=1093978 RepID=A0AAV4EU26_9GAST|nr:hypothetical protein ElyMa_001915600 [Elysia marginata]
MTESSAEASRSRGRSRGNILEVSVQKETLLTVATPDMTQTRCRRMENNNMVSHTPENSNMVSPENNGHYCMSGKPRRVWSLDKQTNTTAGLTPVLE